MVDFTCRVVAKENKRKQEKTKDERGFRFASLTCVSRSCSVGSCNRRAVDFDQSMGRMLP